MAGMWADDGQRFGDRSERQKPFGKASLHLDKQAHGPHTTTGTLSIWPSRMGRPEPRSHSGRRRRESRMPHTSKLWQLEAMTHIPNHDTLPWLWSERFYSVAGCRRYRVSRGGKSCGAVQPAAARCFTIFQGIYLKLERPHAVCYTISRRAAACWPY
jgi:hypothetical protein